MKQAKISEIRDHLSGYLRRVRQGEIIEVTDRDVPIARIVPIEPAARDEQSWIKRLRRSGLGRGGPMRGVKEILNKRLKQKPAGVLDALLEERRSGR